MALSANRALQVRNTTGKRLYSKVIKTGVKFWQGAIVCVNAAGLAVVAANSATMEYLGICDAECLTGNGTRTVTAFDNVEIHITGADAKTSITAGHEGEIAYAFDDAAVHAVNTLGPQIGVFVERVGANDVWVALRMGVMANGA